MADFFAGGSKPIWAARFASDCPECDERIELGVRVTWTTIDGQEKVVHLQCSDGRVSRPLPPACPHCNIHHKGECF